MWFQIASLMLSTVLSQDALAAKSVLLVSECAGDSSQADCVHFGTFFFVLLGFDMHTSKRLVQRSIFQCVACCDVGLMLQQTI